MMRIWHKVAGLHLVRPLLLQGKLGRVDTAPTITMLNTASSQEPG